MLDMNKTATYKLPIKNGYLDIRASQDPDYPGLDIEYIDDSESKDNYHTRPRVLIECPEDTNTLRVLVWGNPDSEDFDTEIEFETASDRLNAK